MANPSARRGKFRALRSRLSLVPYQVMLLIGLLAAGLAAKTLGVASAPDTAHAAAGGRRLLGEFPRDQILTIPEGEFESDEDYDKATNKGFLVLHFLGVVYMFAGLAIVCDDYFVAALEEICERFDLSEDVAGATFMAAGGSAPELFTAMLGVFVAKSEVGFGTIVGSAVFNVLFVIGLCVLFAKEKLALTWWPLFRDCSYYSFGLLVLTWVVHDNKVHWYEAAILLACYVGYVCIMKFNVRLNAFAENCLRKRRNANKNAKATAVLEVQSSNKSLEGPGNKTAAGAGSGQGGGAPAGDMDDGEESVSEAASGEAAVRTLGETIAEHSQAAHSSSKGDLFVRRSSATNNDTASPVRAKSACAAVGSKRGSARVAPAGLPPSVPKDASADPQTHTGQYTHHHALESANAQMAFREFRSIAMKSFRAGNIQELERSLSDAHDHHESAKTLPVVRSVPTLTGQALAARRIKMNPLDSPLASSRVDSATNVAKASPAASRAAKEDKDGGDKPKADGDGDDDDDTDLWDIPSSTTGRVFWVLLFPLKASMYYTIPNCANDKWKNWFHTTFIMSLVWIAIYAYCMVWWVSTIGFALGVPTAVMGLTVLAAGTSIPDALSSVIVARNGFGDMAVSSSIGSNVFDINMGLPLPWLIKTAIVDPGSVIAIESCGLPILVLTLLLMVIFVVVSIWWTGWVLSNKLGVIMFVLYILFLAQSLIMEYGVIDVGC